jgi:hypothetical protein
MVRYDPSQGCFFLQEDAAQPSRNGTYLGNGERLIPGRDYKLNSGETFIVGEKSEVFMVQR